MRLSWFFALLTLTSPLFASNTFVSKRVINTKKTALSALITNNVNPHNNRKDKNLITNWNDAASMLNFDWSKRLTVELI
jgi:hypothetical protein